MPWGPTLETDSKSESNEIWIKLVTSFWRHNGAAMVPQSVPPGLYPLVRAHMSITYGFLCFATPGIGDSVSAGLVTAARPARLPAAPPSRCQV